mgnify:CR=1 FL=1
MKTPKELNDIGQRIYWAVEHGRAGEVISELQAVQDGALRTAAKIAQHAGIYESDHPGCQCASDAIMRVVELANDRSDAIMRVVELANDRTERQPTKGK